MVRSQNHAAIQFYVEIYDDKQTLRVVLHDYYTIQSCSKVILYNIESVFYYPKITSSIMCFVNYLSTVSYISLKIF